MTDVTSSRKKVQQESIRFKRPISENSANVMGGSINYLIDQRDALRSDVDSNTALINAVENSVQRTIPIGSGSKLLRVSGTQQITSSVFRFVAPYACTVVGIVFNSQIEAKSGGSNVNSSGRLEISCAGLSGTVVSETAQTNIEIQVRPSFWYTIDGSSNEDIATARSFSQFSVSNGQAIDMVVTTIANQPDSQENADVLTNYAASFLIKKS